jgi:nucleotide-binding universal stress UspA family protein
VVAYNGGREAARALQAFQLLALADGEEVHVVTVHEDHDEATAVAGLAGDYLAAHGASYVLHAIATEASVADVLLDEIRRLTPRLVVIGAHQHHPFRDLFATSVTRAVLRASPTPVFVVA